MASKYRTLNTQLSNPKCLIIATISIGTITAIITSFAVIFIVYTQKTILHPYGLFSPHCNAFFESQDQEITCTGVQNTFTLDTFDVSNILHNKKNNEVENSSAKSEALSSLHVALEMRSIGKLDKARKLFWHALALQPSHPDVLNHYGEFLEEQENDIIQANHLYTKALVYCPDHSKALNNRERTIPLVEELDQLRLQQIDEKRNLLTKIPKNSAALRRVKKEAYFQHIYHTVGIEGNTMTLSQTRHILETRMAVAGKSIVEHNEILGLDAALSYVNSTLVKRIGDISIDDILNIHKRLIGFVDPIEAGMFRRTQVWVGSHVPSHPSDLNKLMKEFLVWLNADETQVLHPVVFAALVHYKLVYIHPFIDGNGRTGRLLMNLILMRAGFPAVIIPKGERQIYYQHLQTADQGDIRPFVRFIAECTEKTLDVYLYATKEYPDSEIPELEGYMYNYGSPIIAEE